MVQMAEPEVGEGEPKRTTIQRIPAELPVSGTEDNALMEPSETFS
jgi:hypothetical protein